MTQSLDKTDGQSPRLRLKILTLAAALLALCFFKVLLDLARYSFHSELFSYVPLIPFICGYLIWQRKAEIPTEWQRAWKSASLFIAAGIGLATGYLWAIHSGWKPALEDYLAIMTSSFLFLLLGLALAVLGWRTMRAIVLPVSMMLFIIPYPVAMMIWLNDFFDQTSANAACCFFWLARTPFFKKGLELHLPGFALQVAPECSGIHSTLVLLITSLLAGYLFLNSAWRRVLLTVFVLPLAIARNGFRIWVLGELCVHVSPTMIDSPIHHQGGPIFFLLSLIPFFLLLVYLRKTEFNKKMDDKPRFDRVTRMAL